MSADAAATAKKAERKAQEQAERDAQRKAEVDGLRVDRVRGDPARSFGLFGPDRNEHALDRSLAARASEHARAEAAALDAARPSSPTPSLPSKKSTCHPFSLERVAEAGADSRTAVDALHRHDRARTLLRRAPHTTYHPPVPPSELQRTAPSAPAPLLALQWQQQHRERQQYVQRLHEQKRRERARRAANARPVVKTLNELAQLSTTPAVVRAFATLDDLDEQLEGPRQLLGDKVTVASVRAMARRKRGLSALTAADVQAYGHLTRVRRDAERWAAAWDDAASSDTSRSRSRERSRSRSPVSGPWAPSVREPSPARERRPQPRSPHRIPLKRPRRRAESDASESAPPMPTAPEPVVEPATAPAEAATEHVPEPMPPLPEPVAEPAAAPAPEADEPGQPQVVAAPVHRGLAQIPRGGAKKRRARAIRARAIVAAAVAADATALLRSLGV